MNIDFKFERLNLKFSNLIQFIVAMKCAGVSITINTVHHGRKPYFSTAGEARRLVMY